ncbi:hypothetical protein HAV_00352 [Candidatus Hepatincola sp. Av]
MIPIVFIVFSLFLPCVSYGITNNLTISYPLHKSFIDDEYYEASSESTGMNFDNFIPSNITYTIGIDKIYIGVSLQTEGSNYTTNIVNKNTNGYLESNLELKNAYSLTLQYKFYEDKVMSVLVGITLGDSFYNVENSYHYLIQEEVTVNTYKVITDDTINGNIADECDKTIGHYQYDSANDITYVNSKALICKSSHTENKHIPQNEDHKIKGMSFLLAYNIALLYKMNKYMDLGFNIGLISQNTIKIEDSFANNQDFNYNFKALGTTVNIILNIKV